MEKMGYEFFVPLLGHKLPYELIVRDEYIYIYVLIIKSKKWKLDDISFPPFREKSVDASVRYINIFSFFCCEKMRISIFSFYHFTYIL